MRKVYFDDLFLIFSNEGFVLCEHVPYEGHMMLMNAKVNHYYDTPEQLIYNLTMSEEFKALNVDLVGVPHKLINK